MSIFVVPLLLMVSDTGKLEKLPKGIHARKKKKKQINNMSCNEGASQNQ
jgi:hypothetical protein